MTSCSAWGVHLQLAPIKITPTFFLRPGVHLHPLHPPATLCWKCIFTPQVLKLRTHA